jgi:micrococcal nuclease
LLTPRQNNSSSMRKLVPLALIFLVFFAGCSVDAGPSTASTEEPTFSAEPTEIHPTSVSSTHRTSSTHTSRTSSATPGTKSTSLTQSPTATPRPTTKSGFADRWTVEVVRLIDGDTIEVRFPDGHTEDVRLLGVDTPEVHVAVDPPEYESIPDTEAGRDWLRDWGHKASEFARNQLGGKTVEIATDPQADRRGSYGRLLVYVYVDGQNFNRQLIEQGYARLYDSDFSSRDAFASAEQTAQSNDVGLWNFEGSTTPTPTTTVTDGGVSVSIVEIHADADGNDHENLNDEYIVLKNMGESAIDMTGWTLRDEADHTFTFPSGFTLSPGDTVVIRTGSGRDSSETLYWGSDSAVWNNGGDTIILIDSSGTIVLSREYS